MKTQTTLLVCAAAALALFAIGCGDSGTTPIDAGTHPDLGTRDSGTTPDMGTSPDLGPDTGASPDMGGMPDTGVVTDGGPVLTDAGCWEGPPTTMIQFLNHCTDRSTPAAVTGSGLHSALVYADGSVPPIP